MRIDLFDSGCFRTIVPDGWMAFCGIDSECRETPKKVHIFKDAKLQTDIFTHVGVTICFFGQKDYYLSPKFFYDNIVDMEPFTLGAYTWSGYTCTSIDYPYTMLEGRQDGCVFQVMILMKNGDYEISLADADVQAILAGLTQTGEHE
ncbi:MAG: hypothetical protein E7632_12360 [Ruminococcaceae bacterium]|nr:hypothetical protein [Oscillospiraceae bacterium]